MKNEIEKIDAVPSKRLFLSIIADYDINRSICELIDNGLDAWARSKRSKSISISVTLDKDQQTILVQDNAGGLPKSDLRYIVGPGHTGANPQDKNIGLFGVGTKRAVVALAQDIKIKTRYGTGKTFQIDLDEMWIQEETWEIPVYEIDNILPGSTVVELQKLRIPITDQVIDQLRNHLGATYAKFLKNESVSIQLNDQDIEPELFENWAYPPNYAPRNFTGELEASNGRRIKVDALAGLTNESSPASGEYGVYFYCNDRLIGRALKTIEVGFIKGLAGLPHPKVSLTRVIVCLSGDAELMPWNSSKSDINTRHVVFLALRNWLVQVVKDYATLSRIWMGEWSEKVFKYSTGAIEEVQVTDFPKVNRSFLPQPPKSRPRYGDVIKQKNKTIATKKPWTKGLYEGVVAADLISKHQHIEQRNRIALILLDSTLEIAFKEYLVNESQAQYSDAQLLALFKNRGNVQNDIKKYVTLKRAGIWKKVDHYYRLRCKLIHERATVGINDSEIEDFRSVVEYILGKLYKLKFAAE